MRKNVLKTMALCAVLTMMGSGQVMAQKVELSQSVDNSRATCASCRKTE